MTKINDIIKNFSKNDIEEKYKKHGTIVSLSKEFNVSKQTMKRVFELYEIKVNRTNYNSKKHFFNENIFEEINTEEKAYWLGFIYADGCVYKGTGDTYRLQINLKYDDISHLNKFQKFIGSDYTIQIKDVGEYKSAILKVNSTKMCNDLIRHGVICRKSLICTFPNIETKFYRHFIRGYFDGDGCVTATLNNRFHKEVSIIGGEDIIKKFAEILNTEMHSLTNREHIKCVRTSKKENILSFYDYIYKDSSTFLQRKKKTFDILVYVLNCPLME